MRKKLLIYPRFQLALLAVNFGVLFAVVGAIFVAVHRSYSVLRSEGTSMGLAPDHAYFRFIDLQAGLVYQSIAVAIIIGAVVSGVVVLVLSNWLAGPIVRLREHFAKIVQGRAVGELSFRKRDFFPDLPALVNSAVTKLRKH